MRVLLAEANAEERQRIAECLTMWGYECVCAETGNEAWAFLEHAPGALLVLISQQLPDMPALDFCSRVRWQFAARPIYIGALIDAGQAEAAVPCLLAGADDAVQRPFSDAELRVRLNAGRRVLALREELDERLTTVRETLTTLQQTFLQGRFPDSIQGARGAARSEATEDVAGDFYDFYAHDPHCFDVLIGDVSGHGMKAALIGSGAVNQFVRALRDLAIADPDAPPSIAATVCRAATGIYSQCRETNSMFTAFYGRFHLGMRRFEYVDCGHPKPLWFQAKRGTIVPLAGTNLPIGVVAEQEYAPGSVEFEEGDVFLFYTDGLPDARNLTGEFFGAERIENLLRTHAEEPPDALTARVIDEATAFARGQALLDDVTCAVIRID